jgi:hypothetical protein
VRQRLTTQRAQIRSRKPNKKSFETLSWATTLADLSSIPRGGITCSICAPSYISAEEIETFAYLRLDATKDGARWRVFDKSKLDFLQLTLAAPHSCDTTPDRLHWFLMDSNIARRWAIAEALRA